MYLTQYVLVTAILSSEAILVRVHFLRHDYFKHTTKLFENLQPVIKTILNISIYKFSSSEKLASVDQRLDLTLCVICS